MASAASLLLMRSSLANPAIERAQPWLGTFVSIRAEGLPPAETQAAVTGAFHEVAIVHRLMSFHRPDSDISQLNREGFQRAISVHPYTREVLQVALMISALSKGCFDVSVAAELVDWGLLPRPLQWSLLPEGNWRDIELRADGSVVFHRPLWIDLGGIAKGYAVDRAIACLRERGVTRAVVNAGGDIRVYGEGKETITLDPEIPQNQAPVIELTDGSIASSGGAPQRHWRKGRFHSVHVNGAKRSPARTDRFVSVLAESCVVADALTKVVMARGANCRRLLKLLGASAYLHEPLTGWQALAAGARIQ